MISSDNKGSPLRKIHHQIRDEPVTGSQFGRVIFAEAVHVSGLVDAVVVGVNKWFARAQGTPHLDRERGHRVPVVLAGTPQVSTGKARLEKRGVLDNDGPLSAEWFNCLEILGHDPLAGIALGCAPAQHVYYFAIDINSVPDHAVFAWRSSCSDRGECGGSGRRCHGSNRTARERSESRRDCTTLLQLLLAQSIEHENNYGVSVGDFRR